MNAESPKKQDLIIKIASFLPFIILFIIAGIDGYIESRKTTVEYGAEKVHWKWLWLDYTVNFSDVKSVHYTIIHKRTRDGYKHRFEIENIDNCINGKSNDVKLMQLYKFIKNICPEKSKGFKNSGFWN